MVIPPDLRKVIEDIERDLSRVYQNFHDHQPLQNHISKDTIKALNE